MNILYLNANQRHRLSHTAGYATHMRKTIRGFEAAGHQVVRFLAGETQEAEGAQRAYRRMSVCLPRGASRMIRDLYEVLHDRRLYRKWLPEAERTKAHFLYERMNQLHICGLRLARRLGVPFVIEINDPMRETVTVDLAGLIKRYAVRLEDRLVQESDFVVLGSEELKKSYVRRGFPGEKLLVLYPTADLDLFRPGRAAEPVRQQLGLGGKILLGFVAGDMSAGWRRTDLLLGAMQDLSRRHPQIAALAVGDGKLPRSASDLYDGALTFTGKVPYAEVPRYLEAMDICVIPNATWYGSPTKLFEYGAMGKAVIAPRYPPIEEVIEDGVSGLLFAREDQADLVRKIEVLAANPVRREELGQNLLRRIRQNYTWELNTEAVTRAVERRQAAARNSLS